MKIALALLMAVSTFPVTTNSTIDQLFNTSLTVTVRDDLGNLVAGAEIKLFKKEEDYLKEVNMVAEGITDAKGILKLKKLEAVSYYIIARTEEKDNAGGGEKIGKLEEGKFNKITVVIQ